MPVSLFHLVLQLSAYGRVGYSIRARGNTYFRGRGGLPPHRERLHLAALDKVLAGAREHHCSSFEASNGKPCSYKRLVLSSSYHGNLLLGGKLCSHGWLFIGNQIGVPGNQHLPDIIGDHLNTNQIISLPTRS